MSNFIMPTNILLKTFIVVILISCCATVNAQGKRNVSSLKPLQNTGVWESHQKGDLFFISFKNDSSGSKSRVTFSETEIQSNSAKPGAYIIKRDAGSIHLTGKFEGNKGRGSYTFVPNPSYPNTGNGNHLDMSERQRMTFFFLNIPTDFVAMLQKNDFEDLTANKVLTLAALKVDEKSIIKARAAKDNLNAKDLILYSIFHKKSSYMQ